MSLRSLVVLLDASGSMYSRRESTVAAINSLLGPHGMRAKLPAETPLHIYTFNTCWRRLCPEGTTLGTFEGVRDADYETDGGTALYDVLSDLIEFHTQDADPAGGISFVIVSDGKDVNSERETEESVQRNVEFARAHQHCDFIFVGYGEDAQQTGTSIGVKPRDMFLTRDCLGAVLTSPDMSQALSQSMSQEQMPPFRPAPVGGAGKRAKIDANVAE